MAGRTIQARLWRALIYFQFTVYTFKSKGNKQTPNLGDSFGDLSKGCFKYNIHVILFFYYFFLFLRNCLFLKGISSSVCIARLVFSRLGRIYKRTNKLLFTRIGTITTFYVSLNMETEQTNFQIIQTMLLSYLYNTEVNSNLMTSEESI